MPEDLNHLSVVQQELEKLNSATDAINKLEVRLDSARSVFRETQSIWSERLNALAKFCKKHIDKAKPYYDLKIKECQLRKELQTAAKKFEEASSVLASAKRDVAITREKLSIEASEDNLEVLRQQMQRVSEADDEKILAEASHAAIVYAVMQNSEQVRELEKENKSSIRKSRSYYTKRLEFTRILENQKNDILKYEEEVRRTKGEYTCALRNLEKISNQIHEERAKEGMHKSESEANIVCGRQSTFTASSSLFEIGKNESGPRSLGGSDLDVSSAPAYSEDSSCEMSEVSSLASVDPMLTDDEALPAMLASHSQLIQDIENASSRVGALLQVRRSVSEVGFHQIDVRTD